MQIENLAELYHLAPVPWSRVLAGLESFGGGPEARSFLATTRPDGRPHLTGIGAVWVDGKAYFVSGADTRKSRNVAGNPACSISMSLTDMDLVIEGRARRVSDEDTLRTLARRYADGGWPARVEDGAFTYDYSAPSAGPPPWFLFEVEPAQVFCVLAAEPGGATRYRFDD
jgi:pyridoxamine 5'-phosphate oxidase-like protein